MAIDFNEDRGTLSILIKKDLDVFEPRLIYFSNGPLTIRVFSKSYFQITYSKETFILFDVKFRNTIKNVHDSHFYAIYSYDTYVNSFVIFFS